MAQLLTVVLLPVLVVAALFVGGSQQTAHYRSCSLGKGKARLYNCDGKYDPSGTKSVRITNIDTPARYLIKLRHNESRKMVDEICEQAEAYRYRTYSGHCIHKYKKVWIGMLMMINGGNLSQMLNREASAIDHVEVEGTLRVCNGVVQGRPPNWGLDRIDHLPGQPLLNELYTTAATGEGVHVYVLDTGIRCSHKEFYYQDGRLNKTSGLPLSRCLDGFDAIRDGFGTNDCNGHGTHCAGIVGGLTTGVAKDAILHPIRALGCDGSGTYGAILTSLDWISHNLIRPAVISMSLATHASISIDQAISNLINMTGVIGVAAAGNFLQATCNYSPARASSVISVGSSNVYNHMSWFTNYGSCTTLFAPGELVYSTYHLTDSSYTVLSGTSMACPHVAGTAALYLSQNVDARPDDVKQALMDATEPSGVANLKPGTTTKLLNTNLKLPFYEIHPRSFYDSLENSTEQVVVSLTMRPSRPVTLTPQVDLEIGYFVPTCLTFGNDATWHLPQIMSLVLKKIPDFLDHSATIHWTFESEDMLFVASPEGFVNARDTDICKNCGQTADDPKIIPSLPFYYLEDTSKYQNNFNEKKSPKCHSSGADVVFQYTATADMVVNISLCGPNTEFDTLLTLYEKSGNKANLTFIDCSDDSCGPQSFLMDMALRKGRTYMIVVDGFGGDSGLVDFYMYPSGAASSPVQTQLRTTIPFITSIITSSTEVESAICTRWLGAQCETPPTPLPIQAGFFWSPVAWGLCDQKCGGGSQQAVMKCFTGNYTGVASSNCAAILPPQITQVCNMVACHNYSLIKGPWGECNQTCGTGTQRRQVICMDSLGNTANPTKCGGEDNLFEEQRCNIHACNGIRWEAGEWNYCNLPCARGQKFRKPICWSNGTVVGDDNCRDLPSPVEKMECNTHPCQTFAWLVGPWDTCPAGCNAAKGRVVECVDGLGRKVGDSLCSAMNKPAAQVMCQQPQAICNDCKQHNCSNNGVCQTVKHNSPTVKSGLLTNQGTQCVCFKGWEGLYCERPTICKGRPLGYVKPGILGCCPFPKLDNYRNCCGSAEATFDLNGACCEGKLDACGICNGPHKSIDSQNHCCPTIRDEKGICCASGMLDECYICDGDGTTCATNITIISILGDTVKTARNCSTGWKLFMIDFMNKVATQLHVATEALLLTGVQTMDSVTGSCSNVVDIKQGCLKSVTTQFLGVFNFTLLPIPLNDLTNMKTGVAQIDSCLSQQDEPTIEFIPGVKIQSVRNVQRAGICGNGMCERGERCNQFGRSQTTAGPCCLQDCPYVPKDCPIPVDGPRTNLPCSNNGICLDASGHCDCFAGYQGRTCQHCQNGWTAMSDGTCMKILASVGVQALSINLSNLNLTLPPGPWNDNITVTKGTAVAGVLGTMIAVSTCIGLICCIKHCCCTRTRPHNLPDSGATSNIQMEAHSRQAQEARKTSLALERNEAVQERRRSRMQDGGAARKSLLMEPLPLASPAVKSPLSPALTPAPIQSGEDNVISKLRKSIVGESAVVLGGWRKSLAGDQQYIKLDPSTLKAEEQHFQNVPLPPSRFDSQQFQNVPLTSSRQQVQNPPSRYEVAQHQGVPTLPSFPSRYEAEQFHDAPASTKYEGNQYPQLSQTPPTYSPIYEGPQYPSAPTSSSGYVDTQLYQNAPPARYEAQKFQKHGNLSPRYEVQHFQTPQLLPGRFQPTQHFQLIPIPNPSMPISTGAAPSHIMYPSSPSPTLPNASTPNSNVYTQSPVRPPSSAMPENDESLI